MRNAPLTVAALVALVVGVGAAGLAMQSQAEATLVERAALDSGSADADDAAEAHETDDATDTATETLDEEGAEGTYIVHVDGAVAAPGVVRVEGADVRVFDAVDAAGGLLDDADTSTVNLAETLTDGAKIHIPREGEEAEPAEVAAQAGQVTTMGATGTGEGVALVNINQASAEELQVLPGIGEVTARAIIEDRERNGSFASCEDLMRVPGIGEKKFERVQGQICV